MNDELNPQDGHAKVRSGALLVDVREAEEFSEVHASGAALFPLSELAERANELPLDRELVLICRSGARSARAAAYLSSIGYTTYNLRGGTLAWIQAGLPTESGAI